MQTPAVHSTPQLFTRPRQHTAYSHFIRKLSMILVVILTLVACTEPEQPSTGKSNKLREQGIALLNQADSLHELDKQEALVNQSLQLAEQLHDDSLQYAALLQLGYYALTRQDDTAQVLLWKARNGFKHIGVPEKVVRADAALLNYYTKNSEYTKATERILAAEQLLKTIRKPGEDAIYYYLQKTLFYYNIGFPDSALNVVNRAEALCEKAKSDRYKPNLIATRAVIYSVFGDDRKAVNAYLSVLNDFDENTSDKAIIFTNLGNKYARLQQIDSAEYYYAQALRTYTNMGIGDAVIHKLHNTAAFSLLQFNKAASKRHFDQVSPDKLNLPNQFYYAYIRASLESSPEAIIKGLNDALAFAETNAIPLKDLEKDAHYELYERYRAKGDIERALHHFQLSTELNDAIRGEEMTLKIEQLNLMSNIREKEMKISSQQAMLVEKNKTIHEQRVNNWLLAVLMCITALILLLLLLNYRKRMRISGLLLSQTKLERELLISEVSPIAVQIEQAADIIRDLRDKVQALEKQAPDIPVKHVKGAMQEWLQNYKEQSALLEAQKNAERAFLRKIDEFGQLSATEKRVVILIRQGLQSKEIAGRLHLALNTVEIYRSKIRSKMNLAAGQNLTDFIKSL